MTNDHFPRSLRSLLAEVLKTIETIGTIFFSLLAHLSRADRRWVVDGPAPLNQPQHSTPLHKGRGKQPRGLRGGGALGLWLMAARGEGL